MRTALIALACAVALAGCGDDEETPAAAPTPAPTAAAQELTVEVTEAGAKPRTYTCGNGCDLSAVLASAEDGTRACTEIYGGPETAHITGPGGVDVTISRNNGCGIADYEALFEALGKPQPLAPR